jgi:hypothetical protein
MCPPDLSNYIAEDISSDKDAMNPGPERTSLNLDDPAVAKPKRNKPPNHISKNTYK